MSGTRESGNGGSSGVAGGGGVVDRGTKRPSSPASISTTPLGIPHHHPVNLTGPSSSMAAMAAVAAAQVQAMRDYPGLTHYEEDLSDEEIDCDS